MVTSHDIHGMAGRMSGATGIVTFCECGRAYFTGYRDGIETDATRSAARVLSDRKWREHAKAWLTRGIRD